jgi:hypothetical protein
LVTRSRRSTGAAVRHEPDGPVIVADAEGGVEIDAVVRDGGRAGGCTTT